MDQRIPHRAAFAAIILIVLASTSFVMTDGLLRIAIGAVCIAGLLVCVRQLARSAGRT